MRSSGLEKIFSLAKDNPNIIFIGSDLGYKVLDDFKNQLPKQFFMEGISEAHIIGMAAGLALNNRIVYVNTIASFLSRRCLDQIAINLCLENVKVRLFANGGGYIYGPMGPTHTTIEDIAVMMALPNMAVVVPCDKSQMMSLIPQLNDYDGPVYIRVARDNYDNITQNTVTKFGEPQVLKEGKSFALISNGYFTHIALKVAAELEKSGIDVKIIDLHTLRPLNKNALKELFNGIRKIVTMEEHISTGGIYSIVSDIVLSADLDIKVKSIALPNKYLEIYGEQDELLKAVNLSPAECTKICFDYFKS